MSQGGDNVKKMTRRRGGFTLIELVMVITVISVLATMFASLFGLAVKAYDIGERRTDLMFGVSGTLSEVASCIRRAKWIEGELPLSGDTEITLMCDVDEDDVLERVYYFYDPAQKELRRRVDGDPAGGVVLAEGVESVVFSGGPELVSVSLRLSEGDEELTMRTSAGGRW